MTAKRKLSALDQLAEHEERAVAARTKVIEIKEQARQASAEAERLREALVEAYATDDQAQVEKLARAKAKADARAAEPWPERIGGSERAANRMAAEVDGWRAEHFRELLDEVAPDAHAAAETLTAKVAELEEARRHWHQVSGRVASLIRDVPGMHPRAIPNLDQADSAIRELRRDIGDVPAPLPREFATATILPEHDPDEGVRAAARQEIREKSGKGG